jgi:hypothetical protein
LQARAREILRQQQAQQANVDTRPKPATTTAAPANSTPAPVATTTPAPAAVTTPKPAATTTSPAATGPSNAELQARAQEILRQQQASQAPAATATAPATAASGQGSANYAPKVAPKSKADRLADLNALYKADQVTPAEYHKRRAAILAEP